MVKKGFEIGGDSFLCLSGQCCHSLNPLAIDAAD